LEFVVLAIFCGLSAGVIGKLKGSSFWIWFLVGTVLPLLGTLAAVLYRNEHEEPYRRCPECNNVVALHDQVCMRCGRDLDFVERVGPAENPV
jgi:DNA-directed RNA polymerase subunit RPC12/RpoP